MPSKDISRLFLSPEVQALLEGPERELRRAVREISGEERWGEELRRIRANTLADLVDRPEFAFLNPRNALATELERAKQLFERDQLSSARELILGQRYRDLEEAKAYYDAQFRRPELEEVARLMGEFHPRAVTEWLQHEPTWIEELRTTLDRLHAPFLDVQRTLESMSGVAELRSIGHALSLGSSFDLAFAESLRVDLGDWRDPLQLAGLDLDDASARLELYDDRGLDSALVDLPAPAFREILDLSGLTQTLPPLDEQYGDPIPAYAYDEDEEMERLRRAYDWLCRFERNLRRFIDQAMTRLYGVGWARHRVPADVHEQWMQKQQRAVQAGGAPLPLIMYADFTDYEKIICRKDNWREVFAVIFLRPENVRESLQRLYPVRNCAMHARSITQEDELFLYVEVRRLAKVLGP